jgi:hypothetical protein
MGLRAEETVIRVATHQAHTTLRDCVGRAGPNRPDDVLLIQELLNANNVTVREDGVADFALSRAIMEFQRRLGFDTLTGTVAPGDETYLALLGYPGQSDALPPARGSAPLQEEDFAAAARALGCEVAAIKAVTQLEAGARGFLADGRPKMLFEAHLFAGFTKHRFDANHRDIATAGWNRSSYAYGEREYPRLQKAMQLDRAAALQAAGWGAFGIQGFCYKACGYRSVDDFVIGMFLSEYRHLDAFVQLLLHTNLRAARALRNKDWAGFADAYNGKGYKANHYDTHLANYYFAYTHPKK